MTSSDGRKTLTLFVVSAAILFDALDLSITQIGLPSIQRDLGVSAGVLPWVANAYVLTYGGLLLLGGRAADLIGRRRVFVAGLTIFGAMSLVCGLAPSVGVLVPARGLQGVGAALTVPAAISIIATTFAEGAERNRALGVFGACASAGFAVGLVLGGVVTDLLDWRWIFLVKVPVVAAVAALALKAVDPDPEAEGEPRRFDLPGAAASAGGLILLVFVITQLADGSLDTLLLVLGGVAAIVLLGAFVWWESRAEDPLLPLDFFALKTPRVADLASLTVLASPFGFSYVVTLFFQDVQGHSALETGVALLPGALLSALVSRYGAPALLRRVSLRTAAVLGLTLVSVGFAFLLGMSEDSSYVTVVLPATVICFGLGMGIAYPVFTIAAVSGVDDARQGLAAGIQSTALQVGGGIGLALVSAVVIAVGGDHGADVEALRAGAAVGVVLPLIGAAISLAGFGGGQVEPEEPGSESPAAG